MYLVLGVIIGVVAVLVLNSKKLGLDKATRIYNATHGRYDADASKAVPFAIMATAEALGVKVTIQEEASSKLGDLSDTMQKSRALIAQQENVLRAAAKESGDVHTVANFFKV